MPEQQTSSYLDDLPSPPAWSEVAADFTREFPNMPTAEMERRYNQVRQLAITRTRAAYHNPPENNEPPGSFVGRRAIPFVSAIANSRIEALYAQARDRIQRGEPEESDYARVAEYEITQQRDQQLGVGGRILSGIAHIPAIAGEYAGGASVLRSLGAAAPAAAANSSMLANAGRALVSPSSWARTGALTAGMPSTWLPQWTQNNVRNGLDPMDPRGLPAPFAMAYLNTAILGSLGGVGNSITGEGVRPIAQRLLARTTTGVLEQRAASVMASAISETLPPLYRMDTNYGGLRHAFRGEWGEAWQDFVVDFATFAAFSAMHEATHGAPQPRPSGGIATAPPGGPEPQPGGPRPAPPGGTEPSPGAEPPRGPSGGGVPPGGPEPAPGAQARTAPRQSPRTSAQDTLRYALNRAQEMGIPREDARQILQEMFADVRDNTTREGRGANWSFRDAFADRVDAFIADPTSYLRNRPAAPEPPAGPTSRPATEPGPTRQTAPEPERSVVPTPEQAQQSSGREVARPRHPVEEALDRYNAAETALSESRQRADIARSRPDATSGLETNPHTEMSRLAAELEEARTQLAEVMQADRVSAVAAPAETPPAPTAPREQPARLATAREVLELPSPLQAIRERIHRGEEVSLGEVFNAAGLTAQERRIIAAIQNEGSYADAAKAVGIKTKQALEYHAKKIQRKLGLEESLQKLLAAIDAPDARESALRPETEQIGFTQEEARTDPEVRAATRRALAPLDKIERASKAIDLMTKQYLREQNTGKLTPERQTWYDEQLSRIRQGITGRAADQSAGAPMGATSAQPDAPQSAGSTGGLLPPAASEGAATHGGAARRRGQKRRGELDVGAIVEGVRERWEQVREIYPYFTDSLKRLAGQMYPASTRLNREAGEALSRLAASRIYAVEAADYFTELVMGDRATKPEDRILFGAVMTERRLRYMRNAFERAAKQAADAAFDARARMVREQDSKAKEQLQREAAEHDKRARDMAKAKGEVTSIIGKAGSPFKTLDDYRQALQNPLVDRAMRKWNNEVVPVLEEMYRLAEGMEADDPITSLTQIPGSPLNLYPAQPGEEHVRGVVFTGPAQGRLLNPRARKLGFAKQATGSAEAYHLDIKHIIENSFSVAAPIATQANMYRVFERAGLMQWGKEGSRVVVDGKKWEEIPNVKPPKGTQATLAGQTSAFFHPDVATEVRRTLAIDQPDGYEKVVAAIMQVPTVAALASSVEFAYHSVNLGLSLFYPRMVRNVFNATYGKLYNTPEFRKKLLELAQIGAQKGKGMESGTLAEPVRKGLRWLTGLELPEWFTKFDPTYQTGRLLHGINDIIRVTASEAFDSLARDGHVENTETAKRDFINQLTGQYNKKAQNSLVAWLRRTGIGPFATAATTMTTRAVRALVGGTGHRPATWNGFFRLRGALIGKLAAVLSAGFVINYLKWGRIDGDDNTPWGCIKLGVDGSGGTIYYETPVSLVRRGMRAVGLLALVEGMRRGEPGAKIADRAISGAGLALTHAVEGPGPQFLHMLATGENTFGQHIARRPLTGESGFAARLEAAVGSANPIVSAMMGYNVPHKQEQAWYAKLFNMLGPLVPRVSYQRR